MRKTVVTALILGLLSPIVLTGCGKSEIVSKNTESSQEYLKNLEAGKYYVRHTDKQTNTISCEEVYYGNATFDKGDDAASWSNDRIMWYTSDFAKIPTLYSGDSLIMYSDSNFKDEFSIERFEDYGYTIGFCKLKPTNSNRYKISTNIDDKCTYPNGDTDVILKWDAKDYVILDKLGSDSHKEDVRDDREGDYKSDSDITCSWVTRSGTIKGLTQDCYYNVDIYEGTKLHRDLVFQANVHAFGSWEVTKTSNFEYEETNNVINIKIPEFFRTGYYAIEGAGMFRYVEGEYFDEKTNFNVPNEPPEDDTGLTSTVSYTERKKAISNEDKLDSLQGVTSADVTQSSFDLEEPCFMTIRVKFTLKDGYDEAGDGLPEVTAVLTYPNGRQQKNFYEDDDGLFLNLNASEVGTYVITFYDLDAREPLIDFIMDGESAD